jgi:hypothetical protein
MIPIFIAQHPHGSCRDDLPPRQGHFGIGQQRHRVRLVLPKADWFQERLRIAGIQCRWDYDLPSIEHQGHVSVQAVFLVRPATRWEGPLTQWSIESALLREYLHLPHDAFSVHIVAIARLQHPERFHCMTGEIESEGQHARMFGRPWTKLLHFT